MKTNIHLLRSPRGVTLLLVAAMLACESATEPIDPGSQAATLAVDLSAATIPAQGGTQATAVVRNRAGEEMSGREVRWGTYTPAVVTVDSIGKTIHIRGLAPGTARVWAASSGLREEVEVTVTGSANGVEVIPATTAMPLGTSLHFKAQVYDAGGNLIANPQVAWSTSNPSLLVASPMGVVTAIGVGGAQVTATANGRSGSAQVTVTPTAVATVTVAPSPAEATLGHTTQFFATLKDANGNVLTGRDVAWKSSDPAVLEVGASGEGQAKALGSATVTAVSEGKSGTTQVSVVPQSSLVIEVFPASTAISPGDSVRFTAVARNSSRKIVTGLPVSWASSDPSVATMTGLGVATGMRPGTTTITAIVDGRSGSTTLSVRSPAPQISEVSPDTVTAGRTSDLVLTVTGGGFTQASKVRLNGTDRPTEYQSAARLLATLTPADLEEARTAAVTVHTPAPGGGTTASLPFQVKPRNGSVVGDTVQDEIRPAGDIDEIRFEGRAGWEINVYFHATSGADEDLWMTLYDPRGSRIESLRSSGADQTLEGQGIGPIRLPFDGMYTMQVRGYHGTEEGPYRIYVMPVAPGTERIARTVTVGAVIEGEDIEPVGDVDELTFSGAKGQLVNVFFQAASGSGSDVLQIALLSPTRNSLASFWSYGNDRMLDSRSAGRIELPLTGTYTLRITGSNVTEDGGPYRVQVVQLSDSPEALPDVITPGAIMTGESLSPRGDVDVFRFDGEEGEEVTVFFQARTGDYSDQFVLTLYDTDDRRLGVVFSRGDDGTLEGRGFGPIVLPRAGRYTIRINGYHGYEQGPYRFRVMPVNLSPEKVEAAVGTGPIIAGESISPAGDVDQFTFTATRGQAINLMFQAMSGLGQDMLRLEVLNPAGQRETWMTSWGTDSSLEGQQTGRIVLTQDGTYVIRVQANNWGSQGPYRFRIVPLQ